ncbi:hypothetical protein KKC22_00305, partial [Myxococcota bacterium]|nr:hypothetical protein [Myxococcota bacterium]
INNVNNINNINNVNNINNPGACDADPCATAGLHRGTCVEIAAEPGYECQCDAGFSDTGDGCELEVWETCPTDTTCTADVCVPPSEDGAQCLADFDCHENLTPAEGNLTTCDPTLLGGLCTGCREGELDDCPTGFSCSPFGTCGVPCGAPEDCEFGQCAMGVGFCTAPVCTSDPDCVHGTLCVDPDGDGSGFCTRVPCMDTVCSPYNPEGACDPGASCINGACVNSCDPNPCTGLNRGTCEIFPAGPVCTCDEGFIEDELGNCVPDATADCPTGFSCLDGYCVDPGVPFQCVLDGDCGGALTCAPSLPTGVCRGCTDPVECPSGFNRCLAGYCLKSCSAGDPCPEGMSCTNGYCGRKLCTDAADCAPGYTCVTQTDGSSNCERFTCVQ